MQSCSRCQDAAAEVSLSLPLTFFSVTVKRAGKAEQCRAIAQQLGCRCAEEPTPDCSINACPHPLRPHLPFAHRGLCILEQGSSLTCTAPCTSVSLCEAAELLCDKGMRSKPNKTPVLLEITHILFPLDQGIIISACQLAGTSCAHPAATLLAARALCAAWWVRDIRFPTAGRITQHCTAWKAIRA